MKLKNNQSLVTELEAFLTPFKEFIKNINEDEYSTLENLTTTNLNDWNNETGRLSTMIRSIIDKHFKTVTISFHPWSVPQCASGIAFILTADPKTLQQIITTIKLKPDQYQVTDKNGIIHEIKN